jgi:hypothetical protein
VPGIQFHSTLRYFVIEMRPIRRAVFNYLVYYSPTEMIEGLLTPFRPESYSEVRFYAVMILRSVQIKRLHKHDIFLLFSSFHFVLPVLLFLILLLSLAFISPPFFPVIYRLLLHYGYSDFRACIRLLQLVWGLVTCLTTKHTNSVAFSPQANYTD